MLEVVLSNFRCHRKQTYRFFPGLNLIDGTSGNGKSTILDAIHFCLIGKHRNVCTRGEKKCSVTLIWNGLTITRAKLPASRLTIQPLGLEDDAAQAYLEKLVGGENFELTSYMLQKGTSQFFTLSSAEKRKFIESLSQQKIQVETLKDNIQSYMKTKKNQLLQFETSVTMLKRQAVTLPSAPPSYGLKNIEEMEKAILFTKQTILHHQSTLDWIESTINDYTQLLTKQASASEYRAKVETQCLMLEQQRSVLESELSQLDFQPEEFERVKSEWSRHESYLLYHNKKEEVQDKKKTYEQLVQQEEIEHRKKITEMESKIKSVSQDEISSVKKKYEEADRHKKTYKKIKEIELRRSQLKVVNLTERQQEITKRKSFLSEVEQRRFIHSCPSCKNPLMIQSNKIICANLTPITEEDKKQVEEYKKYLPLLEKQYDEMYKENVLAEQLDKDRKELTVPVPEAENEELYKTLRKQLEEFQNILQQNKLWETQLQELKKVSPKEKYAMLKRQFDTGLQQLSVMIKGEKSLEPEVLQKQLASLTERHIKHKELQKTLQEKTELLTRYQEERTTCSDTTIDYSSHLSRLSDDRQALQKKIHSLTELYKGIQSYQSYAVLFLAEKKRLAQLTWYQDNIKRIHLELQSCELFLRRMIEAENRCLEETITLINQKVKYYLDRFFQTDPLIMTLVTEKETKKGTSKPELALNIVYKDAVCDLTSLSGGEYDRCALAFMLAINELSSSPFLILDESISSLDLASSENVLDVLKDSEPNKIVLLVSHQANTGMFDHVITV